MGESLKQKLREFLWLHRTFIGIHCIYTLCVWVMTNNSLFCYFYDTSAFRCYHKCLKDSAKRRQANCSSFWYTMVSRKNGVKIWDIESCGNSILTDFLHIWHVTRLIIVLFSFWPRIVHLYLLPSKTVFNFKIPILV